jgi:DedD protein
MAFFKFRSSGQTTNEKRNAPAAAPAESVESMRRRARHRLVGAAVLVLLGVVGFPMLFDSQPRPLSGDIPIEIPDRNKAKPLAATSASGKVGDGRASSGTNVITETADGTEINMADAASGSQPEQPAKPEHKPEVKPEATAEAKPEQKPEHKPEPKPEAKPEDTKTAAKKPASEDGARALALLQGKKPADLPSGTTVTPANDTSRFVVQVGAFADASKAQEVRQRLEKAGLKTYTNVAKTPQGDRTRVRVGPFASRADADKAADKVKGLSLPAAVLTL